MPSPFPGMDPYVEAEGFWRNFLFRYVPAMADAIAATLPERYIVRVEEDVYLHELSAQERRLIGRPDAAVTAGPGGVPSTVGGVTTAATAPVAATLVAAGSGRAATVPGGVGPRW